RAGSEGARGEVEILARADVALGLRDLAVVPEGDEGGAGSLVFARRERGREEAAIGRDGHGKASARFTLAMLDAPLGNLAQRAALADGNEANPQRAVARIVFAIADEISRIGGDETDARRACIRASVGKLAGRAENG